MYGIKVFDKSGNDLVSLLNPILFLEIVTSPSGSRNFGTAPESKQLKYISSSMVIDGSYLTVTPPNISISGGSASWSNLQGAISFYWG